MMIRPAHSTPLIAALEQLGPRDHLCSIYESHKSTSLSLLRSYESTRRGEKCVYIADDGTLGDVRDPLQAEGIDVDRAVASNSLVSTNQGQAYLKRGSLTLIGCFLLEGSQE